MRSCPRTMEKWRLLSWSVKNQLNCTLVDGRSSTWNNETGDEAEKLLSLPTPLFLLLLLLQGPRIHILGYTTCIVADLGVHTSMVVLIHEFWVQYSLVVAVVLTHMGAWDYIQDLSAHTSSVTVLLKALNPSLSLTSLTHLLQLQRLPDSSITTILSNTCDMWIVLEITRIVLHVQAGTFSSGCFRKSATAPDGFSWLLII